jgi:uncharacterized protein YdbL (DUF1318 family)
MTYEVGSLLLDRDARRFGRVGRSVPGYLYITYLTEGERELGALDLDAYVKTNASEKTLVEMSTALGMEPVDLVVHLRRLSLTTSDMDPNGEYEAPVEEKAEAEAEAAPVETKQAAKGKKKAATKKATKAETKKAATAAAKKAAKKAKAVPLPKSAKKRKGGADPIDDPNSFIKENFMEMSNRELARHTGLSEHTIRRKLGEWRLRRKR